MGLSLLDRNPLHLAFGRTQKNRPALRTIERLQGELWNLNETNELTNCWSGIFLAVAPTTWRIASSYDCSTRSGSWDEVLSLLGASVRQPEFRTREQVTRFEQLNHAPGSLAIRKALREGKAGCFRE
jgi:hypothetical protein